jgi:cytochrome c peroxidase
MKSRARSLVALGVSLAFQHSTHAQSQPGVLDLTVLHNYAGQTVPGYITKNNQLPTNVITNAGATLGRVLFYDKRLSRNNTISCASCHRQAFAFGDTPTASTGVAGTTGRHSMRLINARFATEARFFWDERAATLEAQTTRPIQDHVEMGFSGTLGDPAFADLVTKLSAIDMYRALFSITFGDSTITETRVQQALSQFVRSIQSFDSKYDAGRAVANDNQPFPNFTTQENNGKALFLNPPPGGAGCAGCHRPPEFDIDPNSLNNGVTGSIGGGTDLTNTRSPTLRDMVNGAGMPNGPFMHNGVFTTVAAVINHYAAIPGMNANLDPRLRRPGGAVQTLNLSPQQRNDLGAFLATLTGTAVYTDAKWANPFNAQDQLEVIILPQSATTVTTNANNTLTVSTRGANGLTYQVEGSANLTQWATVGTATADANGNVQVNIPISGSAFYRFKYTP